MKAMSFRSQIAIVAAATILLLSLVFTLVATYKPSEQEQKRRLGLMRIEQAQKRNGTHPTSTATAPQPAVITNVSPSLSRVPNAIELSEQMQTRAKSLASVFNSESPRLIRRGVLSLDRAVHRSFSTRVNTESEYQLSGSFVDARLGTYDVELFFKPWESDGFEYIEARIYFRSGTASDKDAVKKIVDDVVARVLAQL